MKMTMAVKVKARVMMKIGMRKSQLRNRAENSNSWLVQMKRTAMLVKMRATRREQRSK